VAIARTRQVSAEREELIGINMTDTVLNVSGVSKRFGGLQALSDVGISIQRGQVYGLIGPNGAGKTTFFNVLTGLYTPDSGSFELAGKAYQPTAVHTVAKAGIARTFQNIRLFCRNDGARKRNGRASHPYPFRPDWRRLQDCQLQG
jgi:ABC-type uncharacterized transport system ATPase subunit